jgi:hypothetical protein
VTMTDSRIQSRNVVSVCSSPSSASAGAGRPRPIDHSRRAGWRARSHAVAHLWPYG